MREVIVKRLCRTHGGNFVSPKRRGRPPTSCADDYPCSAVETHIAAPKRRKSTSRSRAEHAAGSDPQAVARLTAARAAESHAKPRSQPSEGVTKAKAAKAALEAQGWTVEGRGRSDGASITGARGEELITIHWDAAGNCLGQDYNLWNIVRASANGAPKANLPFDPDEIPDNALVPYLAEMRVTWFNKLRGGNETAVVGKRVEIMHVYSNEGEELPGDRIIRFVDALGGGYRAFRLGALLKIGGGATIHERQQYADAVGKELDE